MIAQLGYGPMTANPQYEYGWKWFTASQNMSCASCGEEAELGATFTTPAAGSYRFVYRMSVDSGATWTYCDNRQGDFGAGGNPGLMFNLEDLGSLVSSP